jgi:hypothetical protein
MLYAPWNAVASDYAQGYRRFDERQLIRLPLQVKAMTIQLEEPERPSQASEMQEASADGRPQTPTPSSSSKTWADILKSCTRVALAIPFLAFVVAGMGSDQFSELSVGDVKLKTTGLRELASIVMALLIVRLTRDASRIFTGLGSIELIFADSSKAETHIRNDYARPVDLYKARLGSPHPKPLKRLKRLDKVRSALIATLASAAAVAVLFAVGKAVWDMFSAPKLAPYLSYSLAISVCILIAIAATDAVGILVSRSSTTQRFKRRTQWEDKIASLEKKRRGLKYVPRLPEPLSGTEFEVLNSIVDTAYTAEALQQRWEKDKIPKHVIVGHSEWPPASHFPFQYATEERQKREESRQRHNSTPIPARAAKSENDRHEIDRLRKEFEEEFRATANSISEPSEWSARFDTKDEGCSVSQYADKIKLAREKLGRLKVQHESIEWCKREAANLHPRLEIPQFWEEDHIGAVAEIHDQIELAHWQETKSIWSEERKMWIKVPAFSLVQVRALPRAIKCTFTILKAHPAPSQAFWKIGQILRRAGWKAIREKVGGLSQEPLTKKN